MKQPGLVAAGFQPDKAAPPRRDRGFTLTEVLVAMSLMGTIVVVLLTAIMAIVKVSSSNDDTARVVAMLTNASDRLSGWAYLKCPEANDEGYDAVVGAAASDVGWDSSQVVITSILYWDPAAGAGDPADQWPADGDWSATNGLADAGQCEQAGGITTARALQLVTIQARSPNGEIVRSLDVVKANLNHTPGTP